MLVQATDLHTLIDSGDILGFSHDDVRPIGFILRYGGLMTTEGIVNESIDIGNKTQLMLAAQQRVGFSPTLFGTIRPLAFSANQGVLIIGELILPGTLIQPIVSLIAVAVSQRISLDIGDPIAYVMVERIEAINMEQPPDILGTSQSFIHVADMLTTPIPDELPVPYNAYPFNL